MTKREQALEVMNKMEDGMIRVGMTRDIWQNDLILVALQGRVPPLVVEGEGDRWLN